MTILAPARAPCGSCPYRLDVPSGVWSADEYEKLVGYDAETAYQPHSVFLCHQQDGRVCAGWASVHGDEHSLGLRLAGQIDEETLDEIIDYVSPVPLHPTGRAAMLYGIAEVAAPGTRAVRTIQRLERRRARRVDSRPMADTENIVSDEELRTLSDGELVGLIEERSNLRGDTAREALTIIRDEIPDDEIV